MNSPFNISRRNLLRQAALISAGGILAPTASAIPQAFSRSGDSKLRLALAAYSFGKYFAYTKNRKNAPVPADQQMDMQKFIRFCAASGVDGAELTSYYFNPQDQDQDFLACRHLAHISGVSVSGTAIGNNFSHPKGSEEREKQMAYTRQWIDRAALMGAPHIRVFAGIPPKGVSEEQLETNAIESLEEAADYAGSKGIFLGIENHDSISTPERLLRITKAVKSPWVGINLDTANFRVEDPYAAMVETAPFALNVQLKEKFTVGKKRLTTDIPRVMGILRDAGYQGFVVLEYEEKGNPYEEVPRLLDLMRQELSVAS
ncbi:sugar phosphate isomerase/epimerase family protein [Roseibacillus persicicus]|uniref:sugar phosphate isomerase/epimerase family protein n=1 Tax=Roseibacillus persicicus TaxID=454148 RepID=UPI0028108AC9|nr:sugar phosphate isomerase/epimerase family protein [Roseibacillus persicicus]MDQ8190204.1 sugar phosphate isomerase/epimerase [Roseibacillus persicicus]